MNRFWSKVDRDSDGCWEWKASLRGGGGGQSLYGAFRDGGKIVYAHRFSWSLVNGEIPEGKELDHLCENARCVNPSHLQLVSRKENMGRIGGVRLK